MAPQTPLLLVDNVFDTVQQYPTGTSRPTSERTGHEAWRVATTGASGAPGRPRRRGRANHSVQVDLGAGVTRAVDSLFIDRGHNLWGKTSRSATPTTASRRSRRSARDGAGGGHARRRSDVHDVLRDRGGRLWASSPRAAPRALARLYVVESMAPVVPGSSSGCARSCSASRARSTRTPASAPRSSRRAGRLSRLRHDVLVAHARARARLHRRDRVRRAIRALRELLFKRTSPWVVLHGLRHAPERAWMYQYDGTTWGCRRSASTARGGSAAVKWGRRSADAAHPRPRLLADAASARTRTSRRSSRSRAAIRRRSCAARRSVPHRPGRW
jgi:hypothetical protein